MTLPGAGIDVAGNTPNIRPGGDDLAATGKRDGFGRIADIPREGGAKRVVMEAVCVSGPDASRRLPVSP